MGHDARARGTRGTGPTATRRVSRALLPTALLALLLVGACRSSSARSGDRRPPAEDAGQTPDAAPAKSVAAAEPEVGHHPPIDCPLRKQGIDTHELRPFEEVEDYIAFLDRADRAAWQRPDAVVEALGLTGGEKVVDLGAGSGYFTFRLARALPAGEVVAIDIEPEMLRHIHHEAMTEGVDNIEVVLARPDDPSVPTGADLVFICDVVHHVHGREAWLGKIASKMRSGAKLVLVEFREGDLPQGPPESIKIPKAELIRLVTKAGFRLEADREELLPYQTFLVFRRL